MISYEEDMYDEIPFELNGSKMGVEFEVWKNADPENHRRINDWTDWELNLFWQRNFYPNIDSVANDLYERGLIEA